MMRSPYSTYTPRHGPREFFGIILALLIAATLVGGGYVFAARTSLPISRYLPGAQPTPQPTLVTLVALAQIQQLDTTARVSFKLSLVDEADLVTTSPGSGPDYSPAFATQILALYLRGYAEQTFWRWIDTYPTSNSVTIYEVHRDELWVIQGDETYCTYSWTAYAITPAQIMQRGLTGGDYTTGIASHPGSGNAPISLPNCGQD